MEYKVTLFIEKKTIETTDFIFHNLIRALEFMTAAVEHYDGKIEGNCYDFMATLTMKPETITKENPASGNR